MGEILKETLGLQLLHWAFARSDVWLSASRCAVEFMKGIHEPLERSAAVLDGIWTADDEDCGDGEDQQQQQRRRWNNGHWCEYDDYEARRDMWLHGLEMNVQRHNFGYADGDDYEVETPNNGGGAGGGGGGGVIAAPVRAASPLLLSPPHNNSALGQRENMQVTQPSSAPSSPLASPGASSNASSAFAMPSNQSSASSGSSPGQAAAGASGAASAGGGSPARNASAAAASSGAAAIPAPAAVSAAEASLRQSRAAVYPTMITSSKATTSAAQPHAYLPNAAAVDTTGDPNWQANKATVRERNAAMFNNALMSDITFVVGGGDEAVQTIPAHKYVLATGSSVFYAMFFGGLADTTHEIQVPDVEPMAFLTLLKYLYCDEITLEADNVLATLYAAKKYIVPHLARACVNYLETSLTAKNACLLLSQSRLFEEPELMQRCWEVIDAQAEMAIKSEGFVDIDLNTFESILGRETLNCKEINLFEAALCWAQSACQKMEIESSAPNRRQVLGKALQLIRIPTMTLEEFANGVAQLGILTADETIDIFLNFTATVKPKLGFTTRPRAGLKTQVCHRFQSCAYRSNQWRYRGRCDSIQFSVDKRIFIVGFGLYGSSTGAADYNVKIELKRLGRVLAENETHFYSDGSSNTFHVFFEDPIQVEPDSFYTASVVLDGTELSFFGQEGMTEVCMGNVQFQFQCSSESTNGTGVQGGQIPELIFYGPTRPEPEAARPRRSALDELNAENERRERELELHPRAALLAANGRAANMKGAAKGNSVGHNAGNNSEGN